jgi:hypothetical protein
MWGRGYSPPAWVSTCPPDSRAGDTKTQSSRWADTGKGTCPNRAAVLGLDPPPDGAHGVHVQRWQGVPLSSASSHVLAQRHVLGHPAASSRATRQPCRNRRSSLLRICVTPPLIRILGTSFRSAPCTIRATRCRATSCRLRLDLRRFTKTPSKRLPQENRGFASAQHAELQCVAASCRITPVM